MGVATVADSSDLELAFHLDGRLYCSTKRRCPWCLPFSILLSTRLRVLLLPCFLQPPTRSRAAACVAPFVAFLHVHPCFLCCPFLLAVHVLFGCSLQRTRVLAGSPCLQLFSAFSLAWVLQWTAVRRIFPPRWLGYAPSLLTGLL